MVKMNYTDLHDFFSNATLPLYGIIKQQSYINFNTELQNNVFQLNMSNLLNYFRNGGLAEFVMFKAME
jgi:hypothetical protein